MVLPVVVHDLGTQDASNGRRSDGVLNVACLSGRGDVSGRVSVVQDFLEILIFWKTVVYTFIVLVIYGCFQK